jgi:aspartyl-tRNA(Asn)/glutamyl-tRNA(Gln) amidotransferase subunit C
MLSAQDLKKLAELSRIDVPEAELATLGGELDAILKYVKDVASIDVGDVSEAPEVRNVMREDALAHESGAHTADLLAQFPARDGDYLKVKKIL